jgi:hypothetical protein
MRRCGLLLVLANGNGRHLHQSNTLVTWIRNSSWHADETDVRNLVNYYSIGVKVMSNIYLFCKFILTGNLFYKKGVVEKLCSYLI